MPKASRKIGTRRRHYAQPPISEAICEFRFAPPTKWDLTTPGSLYQLIQTNFPHRREVGRLVHTTEARKEELRFEVRPHTRIQFLDHAETKIVGIETNLLSVSQLRPYTSWEDFRSFILLLFKHYSALVDPKTIQRLGLRYINQYSLHDESLPVSHFLNVYPQTPNHYPQPLLSFFTSIETTDTNTSNILRSHVIGQSQEAIAGLITIDLEYFSTQPLSSVSIPTIRTWLNHAHEVIENLFELTITDHSRHLFNSSA